MSPHVFLRRLLAVAVAVALILILFEVALDRLVPTADLLREPLEIQGPAALFAKLDYLRRFPGYKVAVVGDSVIFGRSLEEHGDAAWQQHTLPAVLEEKLRLALPGQPVLVLNLGLNGAVPADMERIGAMLAACAPDLLVFDVALRSFSADFAPEKERLSRAWLADMDIDENGAYRERAMSANLTAQLGAGARALLTNHWQLYRLRDLLQVKLLDAQPRRFLEGLRDKANHALLGPRATESDIDEAMFRAMQSGARFRTINFDESNPQRQAVERLLTSLRQRGQPTIVFYAKENPDQISSILDDQRRKELSGALQELVRRHVGEHISFLPPIEALQAEHYLDIMHLTYAGNQILADHLWPLMSKHLRGPGG